MMEFQSHTKPQYISEVTHVCIYSSFFAVDEWANISIIIYWGLLAPAFRQTFQCGVSSIILLHEKFLQFDWLRAVVFQLNLKYLHVKITVSIVTKITKEIKKQ